VKRRVDRIVEYTFIAPMAIFLLAFIAYPVYLNVRISFQDLRAVNLVRGDVPWVGLAHYRAVLSDPLVRQSVRHLLFFTAGSLLFQVPLGLGLALYFRRSFPGAKWMRGSFLLAWTMPVVVVGAIFRWLFDSQFGVLNWLLRATGILRGNVAWLTDIHHVLPTLTAVNVWLGIPFNMALFLTGLQALPQDVFEAATVDGATSWQQFWHITLPLLRPTLVAIVLLGLIFTLRQFDLVWAMTQGGPFDASQLPSTLAYRRVFQQFEFGEGGAILNLLALLLMAIAIVYVWSIRRERTA
jgi:multiple sugar transport system permease protein